MRPQIWVCAVCSWARLIVGARSSKRWASIHPEHWTVTEVHCWLNYVGKEYGFSRPEVERLFIAFQNVFGQDLLRMTKTEFVSRDSILGEILYDVFRRMYESATMSCSPASLSCSTASPGSTSLPSLPEVESNGASAHLEVSTLTSDEIQLGEDSSASAVTMETKKQLNIDQNDSY